MQASLPRTEFNMNPILLYFYNAILIKYLSKHSSELFTAFILKLYNNKKLIA